jgi:hypothetical protein
MGVPQVAAKAPFSFLAGAKALGKPDETPEEFAELLRNEEVTAFLDARDKQRRIERERIAEVGFVQFQQEQHEIKKMMRLMAYFRDRSRADEQAALGGIIEDLEKNPPKHPQEMVARIEAFIDRMPGGGSDSLKQRMKELYRSIKEWMERPDEELGRLAGI